MKGTFIKSPTGTHLLAYSAGQKADLSFLDPDVIADLIESKIFVPDEVKQIETKEFTNKKTKEFKSQKFSK